MPEPQTSSTTVKRVRLVPRRGPFHFFLLLATSSLTLMLPLAYVTLVLALGGYVGWTAVLWIRDLAMSPHWVWQQFLPGSYIAAGLATWLFMFRPLLPRPAGSPVALQVTPTSQPRLFQMVDEICWNLRLPPPEEIWLDNTIGIRSSVRDGVLGVTGGEWTLHIGLPVISTLSAREFSALVVRELSMHAGGLGATFSHLVRELNVWFYRALHERDEWELDLQNQRPAETAVEKGVRVLTCVWMGVVKVPFALFVIAARLISAAALARLGSGASKAAANVIGKTGWRQAQEKMELLHAAWETARAEIQRGMQQKRLPDNLALLLARHVSRAAKQRGKNTHTAAPADGAVASGARLVENMPVEMPAAALLRGFVDLGRQVTCFYYQHELGIGLHEHQLVGGEEVLHQTRREDESLVILRRYFGGLAHPERAMCGLGSTPAVSPGKEQLEAEIIQVRQEICEWGGRLKMTLQEWNLAWQRRRDLEAAALLSLAGFTLSRIQFGTDDASPQSFRSEAARQRMLMEHMESALVAHEARLESRFASALGLLWWVEKDQLNDCLLDRRKDLPAWVSIYEAMAATLPAFRELLTLFFAFQTLGGRYAAREDSSSFFTALQSVVPKMTSLTRQILSTLDGAPFPFTASKRTITLHEHLLQGKLPEPVNISMNPGAAADMKALASKMATDASDVIAPFVDRFLHLYHQAYAWLAESAELTEQHLIGPMDFGAGAELLTPEEYALEQEQKPATAKMRLPVK